MKVKKAQVLEGELSHARLSGMDYADAYACEFECRHEVTADDLQIAFWTDFPPVVGKLFKLRDWVVKPFGIQTGGGSQKEKDKEAFEACIRQGGKFRFFSVAGKLADETMLELEDKHLRCFLSLKVTALDERHKSVKATTLVKFHNTLGRAYFFVIRPFHCRVVGAMLKHVIGRLSQAQPGPTNTLT